VTGRIFTLQVTRAHARNFVASSVTRPEMTALVSRPWFVVLGRNEFNVSFVRSFSHLTRLGRNEFDVYFVAVSLTWQASGAWAGSFITSSVIRPKMTAARHNHVPQDDSSKA